MKKLFALALSLLLSLSLTACNDKSPSREETMFIRPSQFSEETENVLKILDDEIYFFDYAVDDSIKSSSIDVWLYEDGEWVNSGSTAGNTTDRTVQCAVRINDYGYDIFLINKDGYEKSSFKGNVEFSSEGIVAGTRLQNKTEIKADEEIVLWVKLGKDASSISSDEMRNFRNADCTDGIAVTITFYEEELE